MVQGSNNQYAIYISCESTDLMVINLFADNQNIASCTLKDGVHCPSCLVNFPNGNQACLAKIEPCMDEFMFLVNSQLDEYDVECTQWGGECSETGKIYRYGSVAIGGGFSNESSFYQLSVPGGIMASKIKIENCESASWCDYVFDEDYSLMSLEELGCYIDEKGHLPGIPSEAEVLKNGFSLSGLTLDFQVKIEEAFLYLIKMNEEVDVLVAEYEKEMKLNEALRLK